MPKRLPTTCPRPGCNQLSPCPQHGRDSSKDRERNGTRYTPAMRRAAARIRADATGKTCPRCGHTILPGQAVDAGHSIDRVSAPGTMPDRPEHASCNRAAGGRASHRRQADTPDA